MIGFLKGAVIDKGEQAAIILAGCVGYEVSLPVTVLEKIRVDEEVALFIHSHVREDIFALYGFRTKEELALFKMLLSVSGIGPRVALAILSSSSPDKIRDSIINGDPTLLSSVSGVGKKTAEKAVIELKGKLGGISGVTGSMNNETEEIFSALCGLGFQRPEVLEALKQLPNEVSGTEAKIKEAIKLMGKKK